MVTVIFISCSNFSYKIFKNLDLKSDLSEILIIMPSTVSAKMRKFRKLIAETCTFTMNPPLQGGGKWNLLKGRESLVLLH